MPERSSAISPVKLCAYPLETQLWALFLDLSVNKLKISLKKARSLTITSYFLTSSTLQPQHFLLCKTHACQSITVTHGLRSFLHLYFTSNSSVHHLTNNLCISLYNVSLIIKKTLTDRRDFCQFSSLFYPQSL